MKKITILLLALVYFTTAKAQKVYFIYFQSENQQPFYARLGEKILNSTSGGYLILSKLRDSTYSMNIGISGSQTPEQPFSITVNKKDQGFLLKNFGVDGWGLFNFQTLTVTRPVQTNPVNVIKTEKRESNSFTDLLAKAADDSTLKERPVVLKTEVKKPEDSISAIVKQEVVEKKIEDVEIKKPVEVINTKDVKKPEDSISAIVKLEIVEKKISDTVSNKSVVIEKPVEIIKPPVIENPVEAVVKTVNENEKVVRPLENNAEIKPEAYRKSSVQKKSESSTTDGFGLTFIDIYPGGEMDTIRILIPAEKQKPVVSDDKTGEKRFLEISSSDTLISNQKSEKIELSKGKEIYPVTEVNKIPKINSCNQVATEEDFFKLRKKMAAETTDENMIDEGKKVFKQKCFSTEQIKNLSALFLQDEGKYKFFDAVYSSVTDMQNFKSLLVELKEEYYINRFKAMVQ
jgi:hypothetical protein